MPFRFALFHPCSLITLFVISVLPGYYILLFSPRRLNPFVLPALALLMMRLVPLRTLLTYCFALLTE
jgi:hypothetical protein